MADGYQVKKTAIVILTYVEKAASFASSINPIFGFVPALVGAVRKGLMDKEGHELEKDFQAIHSKLESISQKNQQHLRQIRMNEVIQNYGKYEEYIKHQYAAVNTMVVGVKGDPDNAQVYMERFKETYKQNRMDTGLKVYYDAVKGTGTLFGRPLLQVYRENCKGDAETMERHCSRVAHLFQMGLIALMAYTAVTEDDEDEVRKKWADRVRDIQEKMQEVLTLCNIRDLDPPSDDKSLAS
ncbi:rapunzel 2 isoform X2 [Syngnathus acus]|uniref:rapunzel 2 isoform X2 n=1 Tax=Syngnathus acus TaxID=161584 RepID=UPI00188618D3|nr:rapunzel 2 isoform X2 [Syngnathus acus]XP_037120756.1 rapunzel 2 isoform X2 [Syngnathus acus]XP_037120757.1 rapunzel 2 isoform X2 [Syngnathus acus]XP_037120758.1 rapunzel 2 isoform X2 [Syngnathus acus]